MPFYSIKIINSSPLQNRKRDSLFLSSRAELPLGRVFLSKDRLFWDVRPYFVGVAGWRTQGTCYRQRPIGSSTWNQQVACCAEECLRQHLSDASVFGDVFFYRSFTTVLQKKGKNCAKWQKIPHADSHLRKAWLQYVIKLQVSNSIKNKIAGSLVEGNITVPNGAWVRNYDKLNAWELRHLWCGKTAQRKLCEACDEVGFSSVQHAVKSLSIVHFPTRSLSFNTHFLGQRATCSCGVLHGWSHDPCWVAETAEVNANNKVWREETLDIQYWQNFMAIRKVIHGSKLWSVLPPSRWGPLYSHGCKKSCGDVKSFKHRSCLN